jgi:hypothetical protein
LETPVILAPPRSVHSGGICAGAHTNGSTVLVTTSRIAAFLSCFRAVFASREWSAVARLTFSVRERRFLRRVADTLIPARATHATGIDVLANIESILSHATAHHRRRVVRLVAWSYFVSPLYGGPCMPIQARRSRITAIRRLGHAMSSLCLFAFWADEASFTLIEQPRRPA